MIKSVTIQNFQSHKSTLLEFAPGVNVIVGSSDSGKTAIIRSLRWVVWNRPSGDAIRSSWGGKTSVQIVTEGGSITRSKDKQDEYILNELSFKAFGTSVPKEISTALSINEVNLQQQLDAPFLLSESPGNVAAYLNKVARLDKIDTATSNINSWIRALNSKVEINTAQIKKLEKDITKFDYLDKFETDIEVLEQLEEELTGLQNTSKKLQGIIKSIETATDELRVEEDFTKSEALVDELLGYYSELKESKLKKTNLQTIVNTIEQLKKDEEDFLTKIELLPQVESLLTKYDDVHALQQDSSALNRLIKSLDSLNKELITTNTSVESMEDRFHEEMPEVCPLCGSIKKQVKQ